MEQRRSNLWMGLVVLLVIFGLAWAGYRLVKRGRKSEVFETRKIFTEAEERKLEEKMGFEVPDTGERAVLVPVSGEGNGIARRFKEGEILIIEISAALPDPPSGFYYVGWIQKNDEKIDLGSLEQVKGGYLVSKTMEGVNAIGYDQIVVLELARSGGTERKILEGRF